MQRIIDLPETREALKTAVARQPDGRNGECVNFSIVNGVQVPCCIVGQALDVMGLGYDDVGQAQSAGSLPREEDEFDDGVKAKFTPSAQRLLAVVQEKADSWIDGNLWSTHPLWMDVLKAQGLI